MCKRGTRERGGAGREPRTSVEAIALKMSGGKKEAVPAVQEKRDLSSYFGNLKVAEDPLSHVSDWFKKATLDQIDVVSSIYTHFRGLSPGRNLRFSERGCLKDADCIVYIGSLKPSALDDNNKDHKVIAHLKRVRKRTFVLFPHSDDDDIRTVAVIEPSTSSSNRLAHVVVNRAAFKMTSTKWYGTSYTKKALISAQLYEVCARLLFADDKGANAPHCAGLFALLAVVERIRFHHVKYDLRVMERLCVLYPTVSVYRLLNRFPPNVKNAVRNYELVEERRRELVQSLQKIWNDKHKEKFSQLKSFKESLEKLDSVSKQHQTAQLNDFFK